MTATRHPAGRKHLSTRPEVQPCDYSDEMSQGAFDKLCEAVKDLNSPSHKRTIVDGIDWPESH